MKRFIISLFMIFATWQAAFAMSYERAREEALYLTDKMAYELNLNDQQYNDAYEINLDYFLSLDSEADLYADYLSYRLSDLRHILYDWQYNLMLAADYFIRPVYWRSGGWYFPIYGHYSVGHYYYSYPNVYYSYRGGHGRIHYHSGFYASRRPVWNGGLRGHHPTGGRGRIGNTSIQRHDGGRNGYHIEFNRNNNGRSDRGNSFGNSSTRNREGYSRYHEGTTRNHEGYTRNHEGYTRNYDRSNSGSSYGSRPSHSNDSYNGNSRGSYSGDTHGNYNRGSGSSFGSGSRGSYSGGTRSYGSGSRGGSYSDGSRGGSYSGGSRGGSYSGGGSRGGGYSGGSRGGGGSVSRGRR